VIESKERLPQNTSTKSSFTYFTCKKAWFFRFICCFFFRSTFSEAAFLSTFSEALFISALFDRRDRVKERLPEPGLLEAHRAAAPLALARHPVDVADAHIGGAAGDRNAKPAEEKN
jgi:hypothetical protein